MTTVASATPAANRVPKALGTGKLAAGWLTAAVILSDLGLGAGVAGDLLYGSGANTLARLGIGPAGQLLVAGASAPAWSGTGLTYASNVLTVAGSVPGTPAAGQVFVGGGAIKAGGVITGASVNTTGSATNTFAGIVDATEAVRIDRASGNPYLAFRRATVTAGFVRCTAADTIVIESSAAAAICTFTPTGITCTSDITANSRKFGVAAFSTATAITSASTTQSYVEFKTTTPSVLGYMGFGSVANLFVVLDSSGSPAANFAIGTTALVGSERLRVAGGSAPGTPGSTDVLIGAGQIRTGAGISTTTLTASSQTIDRIPFASTGGLQIDSAGLSFPVAGTARALAIDQTYTDTSGSIAAVSVASRANPGSASTAQIAGLAFTAQSSASATGNLTGATYAIAGVTGTANHFGSGTANVVAGGVFAATQRSGSGIVASLIGLRTQLSNTSATIAVTLATGLEVAAPTDSGGHYGTYKGINIAATAVGTTNCIGIDIGAMTGTGAYAIRTSGGKVEYGDLVSVTGESSLGASGLPITFGRTGSIGTLYVGDATGRTFQIVARAASVNYVYMSILDSVNAISFPMTTDATTTSDGSARFAGGISVASSKSIIGGGKILSLGATHGIGYGTGAGGTVTQITSRTTGVTLNKVTGRIALFTAAGSATPTTFTVTCSACSETDTVIVTDWSGAANTYIWKAKAANGSFDITFWTTGGTTSDAPGIHFNIIKGAIS